MPIYAFECEACNHTEEIERPMRDAGNEVLCKCGLKMDRIYQSNIRPDLDDYVATTGKQFYNKQFMKSFSHVNDTVEYAKRKGAYVYAR